MKTLAAMKNALAGNQHIGKAVSLTLVVVTFIRCEFLHMLFLSGQSQVYILHSDWPAQTSLQYTESCISYNSKKQPVCSAEAPVPYWSLSPIPGRLNWTTLVESVSFSHVTSAARVNSKFYFIRFIGHEERSLVFCYSAPDFSFNSKMVKSGVGEAASPNTAAHLMKSGVSLLSFCALFCVFQLGAPGLGSIRRELTSQYCRSLHIPSIVG